MLNGIAILILGQVLTMKALIMQLIECLQSCVGLLDLMGMMKNTLLFLQQDIVEVLLCPIFLVEGLTMKRLFLQTKFSLIILPHLLSVRMLMNPWLISLTIIIPET